MAHLMVHSMEARPGGEGLVALDVEGVGASGKSLSHRTVLIPTRIVVGASKDPKTAKKLLMDAIQESAPEMGIESLTEIEQQDAETASAVEVLKTKMLFPLELGKVTDVEDPGVKS